MRLILAEDGRYYIADGDDKGTPSRNHTWVNGVMAPQLPGRVLLKNQDVIRICNYELVFHEDASEEPPSSIVATAPPDSSSVHAHTEEKLRSLLAISNRLSRTLELDLLLPQVVENLLDVFKLAERAFLILVDDATGELVLRNYQTREPRRAMPAAYSRSVVKECLEKGEGSISNIQAGMHKTESISELALTSVMCAPLLDQDGKGFEASCWSIAESPRTSSRTKI